MYPKKKSIYYNNQLHIQWICWFSVFETLQICTNIQLLLFIKSLQEYSLASQNKNNMRLSSRVEAQKQNTNNTKQGAWKDWAQESKLQN
jgi:hypothetical protein